MQVMDKETMLEEVERLRKRMMEVANEKGFSSVESVQISQRLDTLLNEIQQQS